MAKNKVRVTDVNGQEVALPTLSDIGQNMKQGATNYWNNVLKPGIANFFAPTNEYEQRATAAGYTPSTDKNWSMGNVSFDADTNTFDIQLGKKKQETPMASPTSVAQAVSYDDAVGKGKVADVLDYAPDNLRPDRTNVAETNPAANPTTEPTATARGQLGIGSWLDNLRSNLANKVLANLTDGASPATQQEPPADGGNIGYPEYTPTEYSSQYYDQMNAILNDLALDKFKFDLNGEELYQQYKDQYLRNGRLAMMDTMGQAAGLTGGYGSTYSQNAGQQAYQGYVNELNNVVPDVYNAAYTRWRDGITDKLRQYELLADADQRDYNRWYNDEKMRYDAYADAQNLAYKERALQADADTAWRKELLASENFEIGPDGRSIIYTGTYQPNGDGTYRNTAPAEENIPEYHGISEDDLAAAVEKEVENMIASGAITANNTAVNYQEVIDRIGKANKWDEVQKKRAREILEAMLWQKTLPNPYKEPRTPTMD